MILVTGKDACHLAPFASHDSHSLTCGLDGDDDDDDDDDAAAFARIPCESRTWRLGIGEWHIPNRWGAGKVDQDHSTRLVRLHCQLIRSCWQHLKICYE